VQKLERGQIKRTFASGPLLGYYVACPNCRYPGTYLHDDVHFIEGPMVETTAEYKGTVITFRAPATLSAEESWRCWGCGKRFALRELEIEALP